MTEDNRMAKARFILELPEPQIDAAAVDVASRLNELGQCVAVALADLKDREGRRIHVPKRIAYAEYIARDMLLGQETTETVVEGAK